MERHKICTFYNTQQGCWKGDKCAFLHSQQECVDIRDQIRERSPMRDYDIRKRDNDR